MCALRSAVAVLMAGCAMAGCAGQQNSAAKTRGPVCDEAVGRAVAAGTADARSFALGALKYQIQDVRGYLLQDGRRNINVQTQQVDCRPYPVGFGGTGLKLCVATARLCGV
jgi:hypothetical protein